METTKQELLKELGELAELHARLSMRGHDEFAFNYGALITRIAWILEKHGNKPEPRNESLQVL